MQAELLKFGRIEVEGVTYDHDVVIDGGTVRKRKKGPSKAHRARYGHTPLSAEEAIPWSESDGRLVVGTGVYGSLPIMDEVYREAERRGVEVVAVNTETACRLLATLPAENVHAVLHVTC
jgi:hypothetical protein